MYRPMRREPAAATGTLSEPAPLGGTMVSEGVADEEELAAVEVPFKQSHVSYQYRHSSVK